MQTEIIAKATGTTTTTAADVIDLNVPSIVRLDIARDQVASMERDGDDLVLRLTDGRTIRIDNFYDQQNGTGSDLVLREDNGGQWLAHPGANGAGRFTTLTNLDDLLAAQAAQGGGSSFVLPAILGLAGAGGLIAAVASGGDDDNDSQTPTTPPDTSAPARPTALFGSNGGVVTGTGEAGATVRVIGGNGTVLGTGTVGSDGNYSIPLNPPQTNGQQLTVTQTDAAGNVSPTTPVTAPDLTAPNVPTAAINGQGTTITGTGEPGATVTVRNAAGQVLGTATVDAQGNYSLTLTTAQANGGTLTVTQSDAAGNVSPAASVTAPDLTPPAAPTASIDDEGAIIAGTGEPGAVVTVRDVAGVVLGVTTVDAQGNYELTLEVPQANGEALTVTQSDAAGNPSPTVPLTAPDITPPAAPTVTIAADGVSVSGTGEPGTTLTIRDGSGAVLGTAVVDAQGAYSLTLANPPANGTMLMVTLTDAAGNVSPDATVIISDLEAPTAPTATINGDGTSVTGAGEAGATVNVRDAAGQVLGSAVVAADGSYTLTLSPAQANGETLNVSQTNAQGLSSPAIGLLAPDITAPATPVATLAGDGATVTGTGEPGATVRVVGANGQVIGTATVGADGSFTVPLSPALTNGETLSVDQVDGAGNTSPAATLTAADTTAPTAPSAAIDGQGTAVTGTGEPGATVTVRDPAGQVIGTATVDAQGNYTLPLTTPQTAGGTLTVTQSDAAGNASPATTITAPDTSIPDTTPPAAPVVTVNADGTTLTGTGEPGATVQVLNAAGQPIGTATVGADGGFTVALPAGTADGQSLSVTQADAAGNVSPATSAVTPDLAAPAAPSATLGTDGVTLTGTGEPGATVQIRAADGTILGTATVAADGSYTATLSGAQADGQTLTVTQSDAAGNTSPATTITAPDTTAPAAPAATVSADGTTLTGTGEPGATVQVTDAAGQPIGTATVAADGSFSVTLPAGTADGQSLSVAQTDAADNVSPAIIAATPDLVAPGAPAAALSADGTVVTGTGEIGATVQVINADGRYSAALPAGTADGRPLTVTQTDAAGNVSPPTTALTNDTTAPDAPSATVSADGATLTGTGEAGATIRVTDANGQPVATTTAGPDGSFSVALPAGTATGQSLSVTQTDAAENVSPATSAATPDLAAPAAPTAILGADGVTLTGTGEPGATVQVRAVDGTILGNATVAADGSYSATLSSPQANGETLTVGQTDAAGNASPATTLTAADTTAPAAPAATVSADGATLTGTGEPGATVQVTDAAGQPIGTATVGADGGFTVALPAGTADGQSLSVTQADAAGNVSPATSAVTPDLAAPAAPTAALSADGTVVTGTGEIGATVQVTNADGQPVGTAVIGADGRYSAALPAGTADGRPLTVTQTDAAGNVSPPTTAVTNDTTAPDAPVATVSADGTTLTGTGEAGATIRVVDVNGQPVATTTAGPDGSFSVALPAGTATGQSLSVTQTDAAGNVSPATSAATPDLVAPGAPTATLNADGSVLTGTGEPGATVQVTDANGQPIGTATVAADGSYTIALPAGTATGQSLSVTQADVAGNVSPATNAATPDLAAPGAPTATLGADGITVSGTGEPGATLEIRAADGTLLGTTTVAGDGSYNTTLSGAQANGETLTVTQTDAGGNASPATTITAPDTTAPAAPVATVSADGTTLTGTGEPGATVQVNDANGQPIGTATVAADGSYSVALPAGTADGQSLSVTQADAAGNISPATTTATPDLAAPGAPTLAVATDGTSVSGTGEAGATVEIRAADGTLLGSAVVAADGSYSATLTPAQANGEALTATQTDVAGNISPVTTANAPDITAPAAPTVTLAADGASVFGNGEPGATVQIVDGNGTLLGTGVVGADTSFTLTLTPPQVNGQALSATQTDAAGNISPVSTVGAPDVIAPDAPAATVSVDGTAVTGTGEPFATVTIRAADGTVLGTAVVAADGSFSAALTPAQADGETLSIDQTDRGGNTSPEATLTAPDITAPTGLVAAISGDGSIVTGTGEAGATVTVRDANGATLGTAVVAANGTYSATLTPPQIDSEPLSAVQADVAGNVSAPVALTAPDLTAPLAPTGSVIDGGATLSGTGEAGATVTVRSPDGTVLGTGVVAADGSFAVPLTPAQANGETVQFSLADAAGNVSPDVTLVAPDVSAPTGLTAGISGDGSMVTGTGEEGAIVTVRDANGATLGTATVDANGVYMVPLTPPQIDAEALSVVQADAAGNVSTPVPLTAPDLTAPPAPTGTVVDAGATLTGTGEAGATVTVRATDGTILGTAIVAADGSFAVPLATPQTNGETLTLVQTDAAGNASPIVAVVAADITAPTGLTATISADGAVMSGTGEAGATVTIRDPAGNAIGTATVAGDGSYAAILTPAQLNGEILQVTQADAAGNASTPVNPIAPDLTAPAAPLAALAAGGASVTGTGEAGATVTVRAADGSVLGTATVAADGSFTVPLTTAQVNGETLTVEQSDAAGNISPQLSLTAPDITLPTAPTASIDGTGTVVSGQAEAGATVTVRDPTGAVIGTVTAGANGDYAVAINPPQANGEALTVTQSDAAGNASLPASVTAPDITAPNAPLFTVNGTGTEASGSGEAGTTVTIRDPAGTVLGTAVIAADGSFTVPLNPAQANGGTLSATLTDAGGNASPVSTAPAPDITAPAAPVAALDVTGTIVSGTGEAGATITVRAGDGTVLGTALVAANGTYAAILSTPQLDSQVLSVSQADAAGNPSPTITVTALDQTAPAAPVATISGDGVTLTGTGEVGATVTITDPVGVVLATVPVAADGSFTVTLTPPLVNGQLLTLTQADAAGNVSLPGTTAAPDLVPNDTPGAPTATVALDGASVTGTGLADTTITVRDVTGAIIGTTTVAGDGSYTATLTTPLINGETVRVTQTDAEGDVSPPATALAPDLTPPALPTAAIDATGTVVAGTGEADATLTVTDAGGAVIGTTIVLANGSYAVVLNPARIDGQALSVTQTDGAGNPSPSAGVTAPDLTAPLAPAGTVSLDGTTLTGTGEAGATVTIRDVAGTAIGTAVVAADGSFTATLTPAQANGELLTLTQADGAGNVSGVAQALAPDITAPVGLTAAINGAGTLVTGTGEAGAIVTIRDAGGTVLGTAIVADTGTYAALLTPAQLNGEILSATQVDAAGNAGAPAAVTAPDLTAPQAPAGTVSLDGTTLTGTGEAGATVTIRGVDGTVIGTALVAGDGSFTATLTPAQGNGQLLSLTQADAAGNVSGVAQALAPDFTIPVGLTAAINGAGTLVTGTGEAGATVTIRDASGTVLGTAVIAANGTYAAVLTTPQIAGQALTATQADPAGNAGVPAPITAPDLTAPLIPVGTISTDGTTITGAGEAGATVTIRGVDGAVLGTAIVAGDGSFTAPLTPAQANGQLVSLTQADAAGNVSGVGQVLAPDITAPIGLTAAINGAGTLITGTGEAGATVTIRDAGGTVLGTTVVAANGTYAAVLSTPQINGQALTATQADAAGNAGTPAPVTAPDLIAPLLPVGTIAGNGTILTGTGEPGATVTIRSVGGAVLGTALVAADGSFTATLTPAQANGQIVSLTQADAAGNASGVTQVTAPDITAPIGLTAAINAAGTLVTGAGEAGATVTIRGADGTIIGTTVVAANGTYAAILTTPQLNSQTLSVTQADATGNVSTPATVVAPDLTAPLAPVGIVATNGTSITGTGEAGATVTIRAADGTVLGTAVVAANGTFTAPLSPAQANGQIVSLTQADVAGNVSPIGQATAPDITAPVGLTSTINGLGTVVTGTGEAGATVTIRDPLGNVIGTTVVAANGGYTATLTTPQANGQLLQVTQADAAGNASLPNAVRAPDITPPAAPIGFVNGTGTVVTGTGEAGATVRILDPLGQLVGTAVVAANGSFSATLTTPQANGQALTLSQTDAAGNASGTVTVNAPDITPPAAPTAVIDPTGSVITGSGEPGARIEVRNAAGTLIGTGTVTAGGLYAVTLTSPQVAGQALGVGARDAAGNLSPPTAVTAPFDISAFDNTAIALVDLNPVQTNQNAGTANYTALVSLGLVNLNAQVLAIPNVQFTVQPGHTLAATFTYDATANVGVASGYSVVIQRFNGTNWVAVNGGGNSSLLQVGLLNGDLVATADLGPGQYRAFVTFDNTAGVGLLGSLNVRGVDSDFTDVASAVPGPVSGNVITDPGPTGQIDVVSPQTRVESVTLNGVTTQVTVDDTVVTGQWGTLIIDRDGSYTYTPNASAASIGKVDSFTYTLLDASDNERESARLTISIGSPDITGAPIAVNDTAIATANFTNVVVNRPAVVDSFFSTPAVPLLGSAQTTRVNDSFTVDANSSSTVTLSAVTTSALAVLPSYTITVTNSAGTVVGTASGTAVAGVGGLIGSGISVTLNNLASGTYNYTVVGTNGAPLQLNTNVYVAETVTRLNEFNPPVTTPVSGQLTANDTLGSPFIGIKVLTAAGFQEVGETPITLTGAHGQLVVNETGGYTYTPIGVTYSATDPIDSFTYQLIQPDGQFSTARLDVAVNINNGVAPVFPAATITALSADNALHLDADVVPLTLAADNRVHTDAPALDQADARLALSLMEGQGDSIEDVLGRYLETQESVTESITTHDDAGTTSVGTDISMTAPLMDDPLSYLSVSVDPDQERMSTMHIM